MRCRAILWITLGIATTVFVAWACALWLHPNQSNGFNSIAWSSSDSWTVWMARSPGAVTIQRTPVRFSGPNHEIFRSDVPSWSKVRTPPADEDRLFIGSWIEDARGWPLVCMRSEKRFGSAYLPEKFGDLHQMIDLQPIGGPASELPMRPIWGNFLFNAGVFALAWCALLNGPLKLRQVFRQRSGRCTRCGYDVRYNPGPVCPECGDPGNAI